MALPTKDPQREHETPILPSQHEAPPLPELADIDVSQRVETTETHVETSEKNASEIGGTSLQMETERQQIGTTVSRVASPTKDRLARAIEGVMEEDMTDLFLKMSPEQQQEFKSKGEETVSKIKILLAAAKVNTRKIFSLIKAWLKMIPGVNRFFLLQEAKIKTDKIIHLS